MGGVDGVAEGGSGGGLVVAEGTPEQLAKVPDSYTGQFLAEILAGASPAPVEVYEDAPASKTTPAKKTGARKSAAKKSAAKSTTKVAPAATKKAAAKKAAPAAEKKAQSARSKARTLR